ncbi:MAG: right-handed parallel beta-helix repeat-containing protein [Desulfuromonadaceae bacterium]|nr:right-handed parallel beta-helix repeat-containing protein [Desulfuromonadaceae bacterium]MDD2855657.1 right-handed parallel beta-helix repeat-containing protein [Desulfuromonadaceae bacterium]
MKTLISLIVFLFLGSVASAAENSGTVYDSAILKEDVTWRGTVLVRGSVVVAPHSTLRIEPGTVIRFAAATESRLSNLVIQGRLHAAGTVERPVVFTSEFSKMSRAAWGGLVFISTAKRNVIEQSRIENVDVGIDVRFSTITLKGVSILHAETAFSSQDGVVQAEDFRISGSETGALIFDSEFEGKNISVDSCKDGLIFNRSAFVLVSPKLLNNKRFGINSTESRVKITDGEFAANAVGAQLKGGEGQIFMSAFLQNRDTALHLNDARIRIERCLFSENKKDALRVEDGRSLLFNNAFSANTGFNLYNAGNEVVSARQNWWGGGDRDFIYGKIYDAAKNKNSGVVQIYPWLNEKPQLLP